MASRRRLSLSACLLDAHRHALRERVGGRADDIYGAPLPVPSSYRNYGVSSAIVLGPLGAWQVPARYTSRPVMFVPSQFWPDAVRTAVVDALAEALVRDVMTPPCEPGPGEKHSQPLEAPRGPGGARESLAVTGTPQVSAASRTCWSAMGPARRK